MADDADGKTTLRLQKFRQAGAIAQGLALGFLVVLAGMELASLAGHLSPFKYQGF
jgi:hypothetical protein